MIDEKIGDYTIIKSLGKGGFGSVYKARTLDGINVALKILNPQALDNKKVVKKFFHEAMILAKLDHPHICKLIEFFPDGDNYAIVMEYVEGVELKQILKETSGIIPFEKSYKVAQHSLDAFQYAFEQGIIHRDIKPGNIMIAKESGDTKIMDFGIAKMSSTASHDTAASMLSVHYVPPERFDPSREIDQRADVYSLGLVFYELFAGRRPFNAEETSQVMFCHLNEIPEPVLKYSPSLPPEISEAIAKALEKDPNDRFHDFKAFKEAMALNQEQLSEATQIVDADRTIQDTSFSADITSTSKVSKSGKKMNPMILMAIIAVLVMGLGIGGFFFYNQSSSRGGPSTAESIASLSEGTATKNDKGFFEVIHPRDQAGMVLIPEGEFTMGSDEYTAEKPVQKIFLDSYYIDKFLVTNGRFRKFIEATGYVTDAEKEGAGMVRIGGRWKKVPGATWRMPDAITPIEGKDNHPVSQVSFNDAQAYCRWAGKELPTEAQWEKAARGPEGNEYPWGVGEPNDTMANFDNLIGSTTPIDQFDKGQSYYGLYDMAGNVYQWCRDWYAIGKRAAKDPTGPETGSERLIKGGSFIEGMESLRSANRDRYDQNYSSYLFGFRCACEEIKK